MQPEALTKFEWHDLPVERLSIFETGFYLIVTPYNETAESYERYQLTIESSDTIRFDLQGEVSQRDLACLEVSDFDFESLGTALSGELGILPGSAGFWKIGFTNGQWSLKRLADTEKSTG